MILNFCIAASVFWVYLILEANSLLPNEILEYWVRDPKFDYRRDIQNNADKSTNKQHTNKTESEKPAKQYKNETITPIGPSFRSKVKKSNDDSLRGKNKGRQNNGRAEFESPKTRKIRTRGVKRQGKDDKKSTRMIPQVENQAEGHKWWWFTDGNNKTKAEEQFRLSPYAITDQLTQILSQMPEANFSIEVLARTVEYNNIVLVKVTERTSDINTYFRADDTKYIDEIPEKKIIFIVHGLSVMGLDQMSVFKQSDYLLKLFSYYFAYLDKFDIFLIPMANPDGYAYVMNREGTALWNKNLSPQSNCAGVALDRNFHVAWNTSMIPSPCSQQYPGPAAFSEPETIAVRDVLHRHSHKIAAYMHLHAGTYNAEAFKGDAVLYPKGFTDIQSDDDKYVDLKGEIEETMKNASFKYASVTVDTLYNWYGKVYGSSVDYASTVYGVPYAMELVMQIYENEEEDGQEEEEDLENIVLEEIWARVIDVIFRSIWKHVNDVSK